MAPGRLQQQVLGDRVQALENNLLQRYGSLLTSVEVAEVLRYPSAQAVLKARMRGSLPVPMMRLPSRRSWFMSSHGLAKYLASVELLPGTARRQSRLERHCPGGDSGPPAKESQIPVRTRT